MDQIFRPNSTDVDSERQTSASLICDQVMLTPDVVIQPPSRPQPPVGGHPIEAHQIDTATLNHQHLGNLYFHHHQLHSPHSQGFPPDGSLFTQIMHQNGNPPNPASTFNQVAAYPSTYKQPDNSNTATTNNSRIVENQATCELPSMEVFPGSFDFHVNVARSYDDNKRPAWEYSEALNKLFVMEGRNVPLQIKVKNIDSSMYVRAVAIFCDPDSSNKPVLRCPNHLRNDEPLNKDYKFIDHVIRCDNQHACYEKDPRSERRSVSVPLGTPQPGSEYVTVLYSMMCRSSCINGINRRGLAIIFTLEREGKVIGRQVLAVRVCASPHRDRMLEEKRMKGEASCHLVKNEGPNVQNGNPASSPSDPIGPLDQMFFVPVNNCDDYVVLAGLALDLVKRDYPEGQMKEAEIQRYQSILDTMGDNQQ